MKRPARVAIVGRPNVGKSTLFNRITRKRRALVHPEPGVTRDVQRMEAEWAGKSFELIDTGGLFSGIDDSLIHQVESRALDEALTAEAMIFVTDGETGVTANDVDVADKIRGLQAPIFLAVNKTEKTGHSHADAEFYKLGCDRVFAISAQHGHGIGELLDAVADAIPDATPSTGAEDLKIALVGRPNVGKSSLVNSLVGSEANIVDSRPGTTRDSVDLRIRWHDRALTLVDTAGIRRRSRSKDGLTSLTALKSIDAIERADVAVVVLDASEEIANQDVKVTSYAHKAGKGLMFCINKWDLIEEKTNASVPDFMQRLRRAFRFAAYAPVIFVSALSHQRVNRILETAWRIGESGKARVSTSEVNRFLEELLAKSPIPYYGGGNGKIYYGTQVSVSPPTFNIFVNRRAFFSRSYLRFLNNRLRERYGFEGTAIRIKLTEKQRERNS
jgi:GTP-binding protein